MGSMPEISKVKIRSHRIIKYSLILTIVAALIALLLLIGELVISLDNNYKAIETKAINGTMADAKRISKYAKMVEGCTGQIETLFSADTLNKNKLLELISHHQIDNPWKCSINIYLNENGSKIRNQILNKPELELIFKADNITVFDSESKYAFQTNISQQQPTSGWQKAQWSNEEHGMTVCYQRTLHKKDSSGHDIQIGLIAAKMNISQLNQILNNRDIGSYGYRFIEEEDGTTISHPNKELVVSKLNFLDNAKKAYSVANQKLIQHTFADKTPVTILTNNIISQQLSMIRLEPVPVIGWVTGITLITQELSIPDSLIKTQYYKILTATSIFLVLSGFYFFLYTSSRSDLAKIAGIAWFSSAVFLIALVTTWFLQINFGNKSPYADQCITTLPQIEQYKKEQIANALNGLKPPPEFIQVGALVRSGRIDESLENVDLYGIIWERIPDGIAIKKTVGIKFPDEIETTFKEEYRVKEKGYTVVGWSFKTKIRQDFITSIYPFDRINIRLRIRPAEDFTSIIFLPDIESYKIISPSACKLVADNFHIPGWQLNNTYYKLYQHTYGIDYGLRTANGYHYYRDILLNISFTRDWISSFISVLIPIFVIFYILFSGIRMITTDAKMRKMFNFDAMRTSIIGATFIIFLVIASQHIRGAVIPNEILYVEKIYFIIYFAILANITVAIGVTEQKNFILFQYRHGLIFRYLYWPFYLGILYIVTLCSFWTS